jgi:MFS family permease
MGLSIVALCSIAGKLGAGFLCDRFEPRHIFFVALVMTGSGALFSLTATDTSRIYLFAVCLGLGYGGAMVCGSTLVANYFGGGSFASVMGVLMPITTTVSSLSPFFVGMTYDIQGSYSNAFLAIALLSFTAGTLLLLFGQPPQHHSTKAEVSRRKRSNDS